MKKAQYFSRHEGQSTIEFLLTFIFSIGILILFISLGLNLTRGYIAHYATYMASRTYLTADNTSFTDTSSDSYAEQEAENVFNRIADASTYVHEQIQQTAASAQQIAAGSTQVLHAVSEMTSFANQSAASSSSISSASVRQLQSLQTIDQTAEFLSGLVEELGSVTEKLAKQA